MEPIERVPPPALVHELVPLGDLVTERATRVGLVAERGAAVHATRGSGGQQGLDGIRRVVPVNLLPVLQALIGVAVAQRLALVLDDGDADDATATTTATTTTTSTTTTTMTTATTTTTAAATTTTMRRRRRRRQRRR